MKVGVLLGFGSDFDRIAHEVRDFEALGVASVSVAEAYTFDAVSQLGYLAAVTERMTIVSRILPLYSRTPSLLAMTAAGLDYVSNGRFQLGIGASGPQVVEGFHGIPYDAPLGRTRETIAICRQVWRRQKLEYAGKRYRVPLPAELGTGLGKPLKLINKPVRETIPISIAAIGPKNVELAAELAEGWQPIFFHPGKAESAFGAAVSAGLAKREPQLGALDISVEVKVAVGSDADRYLALVRPQLALYIGGMGSRSANFYNDLAVRYGYGDVAAKIQDLYLSGRKDEAAAAVPDDLVRAVSLIGTPGEVERQVSEFAAAGVTGLTLAPLSAVPNERISAVEAVCAMTDRLTTG